MEAKTTLRERILAVRREAISLQIEALDQLADAEIDLLERLRCEHGSLGISRVVRSIKRNLQCVAQSRAWLELSQGKLDS